MRNYFDSLNAFCVALLLAIPACVFAQSSDSPFWQDVPDPQSQSSLRAQTTPLEREIIPQSYRTVSLQRNAMQVFLDAVPTESSGRKIQDGTEITLPLPEGGYGRFKILESPIMEQGLANQFPEIKTFIVQGVDDPASSGRIDQTPKGFRACIYSTRGRFFIDPYWKENDSVSMSYYTRDYLNPAKLKELACGVLGNSNPTALRSASLSLMARPTGALLKIYRLALACTGEYAAAVSTAPVTIDKVMAAMVTSVNRVNSVYEKDFSIRMILVNNNSSLIFTTASTDPYTNTDGIAMLTQNQTKVDAVIGSSNYDIGHVFSTGGGGIAGLGVVCVTGRKAEGVTGSPKPVGDAYDIDYVAHEMGHQFGGNHTFNGTTGSASGNRNASTAYEPGSGSTIMAYAGICAPQDLQSNSDPYFHSASYTEIDNYTTTGTGKTPSSTTSTGNNPPVIAALPTATISIPSQTPFALTASASDLDGDSLTYCWEEFDAGSAQDPTVTPRDNGSSCIFRSYSPTTSPTRFFPSLPFILLNSNLPPVNYTLNGTTYINGETIPTTTRTMNFRVAVRDNRAGGGGQNWAAMKVATVSTAGPFKITSLNSTANLSAGAPISLTWNVANTTVAPISCANVEITYSTDGGNNFPVVLASSVPNTGSAIVTIPSVPSNATSQGRFKIEAVGNIFFDISDVNFVVTAVSAVPTIGSFYPTSGFSNTRVILTGTDFSSASAVTFNGVPAIFTIDSNSQITAKVPSNAGTGTIRVQNSVGWASSANPFTVNSGPPAPEILSFSPTLGIGGSNVTVSGSGFINVLSVSLAGANASFTVDSLGQITVTVPNGSNSGPISVTTTSGTSASNGSFTVLQGTGAPVLSVINPSNGTPGSLVTISGNNFYEISSVLFNGQSAGFTVDSPTQITTTVPGTATSGKISVTNSFGTGTSATDFVVVPIVLSEDFAALTSGDNTSTANQSTVWPGDALFTTVVKAYEAGGAVKLGTGKLTGSITSKALDLSGGAFDVSFDVKGWTAVEGQITVTATGQTAQMVTYTSVMSGSFETKVVRFSAGTAATTITLATTAKRAFLDNIIVTKASSSVTAPVIGSSLAQSGTVGSAFNYQIAASSSPVSYGATGLPGGLGINTSTGAITGTPTGAGTSNVTISATNSAGTGSATLVITVNSSASAPVISSSLAQSGTVGTVFSYQITASGIPTSYGATVLPGGLILNTGNGAITGTPTTAGTFNVSISATNSSETGTATLVITVSPSGGGGGSSGLIAGWDFQTTTTGGTIITASPNSPLSYAANFGTGTIYLDGSNGSSTWTSLVTNPEVTSFTGTAVNAGTGFSTTITSPACLALANNSANGKTVIFKFSMSGRKDLVVSYATQRSGTGFTTHLWETSPDGSNWTAAETKTITATSFAATTLTTITSFDNASTGYLRLTVTGATATAGNNRLDNIQLNATGAATTPTVSVSGTLSAVNTTYGTASTAPTSFTASGLNLTEGILINAPLGYEISQTAGGASGYSATQTVGTAGTVVAKTIYVRLMATTPVGTYFGNVTCNSAGSAGATVATVASSVGNKQLTISGLVGVDKFYNGTTAAQLTGTPIYVGLVNGDDLSVTGVPNASFSDKNVRVGKTVTISGFTGPNGNYAVTPPTVTANIKAKDVVIVGLDGSDKSYDGTQSASLIGTPSLLGVEAVDQLNVVLGGTLIVSFVSPSSGSAVELVVSGYALTGTEAPNYQLIQPLGLAANIFPKPATIRANDQSKSFGVSLNMGPGQTHFTFDGLVPGERIGTVTFTADGGTASDAIPGNYLITPSEPAAPRTIPVNLFQARNYDFTFLKGTLTVTAAVGPTFAEWAGEGVVMTPELLMKYAIGGAASSLAPGERPETKLEGTVLSLTAIVRKDATLTIIGQAVSNLGDYGTPNSIVPVVGSAVGVSQDGVPAGCERQKFTMDAGSARQAFLRMSVTK